MALDASDVRAALCGLEGAAGVGLMILRNPDAPGDAYDALQVAKEYIQGLAAASGDIQALPDGPDRRTLSALVTPRMQELVARIPARGPLDMMATQAVMALVLLRAAHGMDPTSPARVHMEAMSAAARFYMNPPTEGASVLVPGERVVSSYERYLAAFLERSEALNFWVPAPASGSVFEDILNRQMEGCARGAGLLPIGLAPVPVIRTRDEDEGGGVVEIEAEDRDDVQKPSATRKPFPVVGVVAGLVGGFILSSLFGRGRK